MEKFLHVYYYRLKCILMDNLFGISFFPQFTLLPHLQTTTYYFVYYRNTLLNYQEIDLIHVSKREHIVIHLQIDQVMCQQLIGNLKHV